ncbi:hypothetical protein EMIHUDRAFT_253606 [Emiliania huxleyi CCMP1516]|uniref:Uncharacterized protein n=2 Tax=Emiliania huxleyi TaxID=2903 RepID=A0A0D3K630_EMIH1|nr:hypothetical protein EMIHUDRAFT_253606 [Emiliania huxleyi CCMP1516]EOD31215.1 hypothetical protein EMIHUDRAFT_253606 [Emiliania huxleyi CCMP1516]|eukprot:XP_005783644.1 hypothetical protein EMIHUDRAFT_253606 [Emiliania huxleyi CCMP1516]
MRLFNLAGIVLAVATTGALVYLAITRVAIFGRAGARTAHRLTHIEVRVGFQPKLKVLISFYQIAGTLGPVYGVRLHEDFTRWMDIMDAISFDFLGLTYPDACIGSMRARLLISALWPCAVFLLVAASIACHAFAQWLLSDKLRRDLVRATQSRLIYWAILVAYLAMDRRIVIAPVAEQEPSRGGVPFRNFFQQTPQVLQQPPYKLFDTLAVPLYSSQEHRKVSLRHVLRGMGAEPCDAGLFQQHWQRLCRRMAAFQSGRGMCSRCCLTQTHRRRINPSTADRSEVCDTAVRMASLSEPAAASPQTHSLTETEPAAPRQPGVLKRSASYHEGLVVDREEGDEEAGRVVESLNLRREDGGATGQQ